MDARRQVISQLRREFGNPANVAKIKVVTVTTVDQVAGTAVVTFATPDAAVADPPEQQTVRWASGYFPLDGDLAFLQIAEGAPTLIGAVDDRDWTDLPMPSGWGAVAGAGVPGYKMLANGIVRFRGGANIPANDPVAAKWTMPVGFRPRDGQRQWAVPYSNGTAISGHLRYNIGTSGNIASVIVSPAATVYALFEGLSYDVRP